MIVFNRPYVSQEVIESVADVFKQRTEGQDGLNTQLSGDGKYTALCHHWFEKHYGKKALLTHSCTAALEMAALLINLEPGDEVIMPSYTFVSTANAFVLRGAVPVFVDVRPDNFNLNETLIEAAITPKTKAIVCVHYAGVACEMDTILQIAQTHGLFVIEDAAQAFDSKYKNKKLGTLGHFGCLSFHETKNIGSGEGGLLLINDTSFEERAEIIREKGTNRSLFFRGQVDKYSWVDVGSSYLPSDLVAAYLYPQLLDYHTIQKKRLQIWAAYDKAFSVFEKQEKIRLPRVSEFGSNNAHMFYLLFNSLELRTEFIAMMRSQGIMTPFHYVPLHSSIAGQKFCRVSGAMEVTNDISDRLVRLPLFYHLTQESYEIVIEKASAFLKAL